MGFPLGDAMLVDSLLRDGLVDTFDNKHMGLTAEHLANKYDLSREAQDEFALLSQSRWSEAHKAGIFESELVRLDELAQDEHPRPETTRDSLASLKTVFEASGTVTAGNASGINDGAAMLVVAEREFAKEQGWPVLAVLSGSSTVGCDPQEMGLGPVHATRKLCEQLGVEVASFDQIELNEAFAAQVLACLGELKLETGTKLNPHGGAIRDRTSDWCDRREIVDTPRSSTSPRKMPDGARNALRGWWDGCRDFIEESCANLKLFHALVLEAANLIIVSRSHLVDDCPYNQS